MGIEKFKDGTIFGDTKRPHAQIKEMYPNAIFIPVCAFGHYISVYENANSTKRIADYMYLKKTEKETKEAKAEKRDFCEYFKIKWYV